MQNIVFDVGNVLIKWDPVAIIKAAFPELPDPTLYLPKFKTVVQELDSGSLDIAAAKIQLQHKLNLPQNRLDTLFNILFESLQPLPESVALLAKLAVMPEYKLYCLTNMGHECYALLTQRYDFFKYFLGIVVSADLQLIKPDPRIYQYLLKQYQLDPSVTIFIDDMPDNIAAAQALGIHGIQFIDYAGCIAALQRLGVKVV